MNFQPPSKSLTPRDYQFIILALLVVAVASFGLVRVNLSLPRGGGDFLVHWVASRGFITERLDPYSGEVPARVQQLVYGGAAQAGSEPYILDTPFHLLLLYFPFALLPDPQTARAIFNLLLELSLLALALLSLRLTDGRTPLWFALLFVLFGVTSLYAFQAILESNPVILLGLFYAGILWALKSDQDEFAGALAAFSCYYWEVGLPFLLLVLWRSYRQGRTRILASFGLWTLVLGAVSFLVYSNWFLAYLRAGMNNLRADFGFSVFTTLRQLFPTYGQVIAWAVIVILLIALGYEWNPSLLEDDRRFYWVACLSLAAAPLLGFRSELENLSVLLIPLALVFSIILDRWGRLGGMLVFLLLLAVAGLPWGLYFLVLPGFLIKSGEVMYLFLPVFTLVGLYWVRWWALRPPRLWVDLVSRR
ncbi:MAG TPA: hypothetical protein PKL78_03125 [Anaerolineales bacterium]|nr:hypothetical protein [Anaerolineales bacterium]